MKRLKREALVEAAEGAGSDEAAESSGGAGNGGAGSARAEPGITAELLDRVERAARKLVRTMPPSVEYDDLVQDGMLGLLDARKRYRPETGTAFPTFANRRIRGAMLDGLRREAWPRVMRAYRRELNAATAELQEDLGRAPTPEEVSVRTGWSLQKVHATTATIGVLEWMGAARKGDPDAVRPPDATVPAMLNPPHAANPERLLEAAERSRVVRRAMARLDPRERGMLAGVYWREEMARTTGERLGMKETRASQIRQRALEKLRKSLAGTGAAPPAA